MKIGDAILKLLQEGKTDVAAALVYRHYRNKIVGRLIKYHLWTEDEAVEIFHDAILIVFQQVEKKKVNFLNISYFATVANNIGSNKRRSKNRNNIPTADYEESQMRVEDFFLSKNLPFAIVLRRLEESDLSLDDKLRYRAFKMLPEQCQEHLTLIKFDKKNHADIPNYLAKITSSDSSKTMLSRCKKKLESLYENLKKKQ